MEEISITERFCKLAADRHHFRNDIDLFDETLREGAERSTIFPSIDEKVTLSKSIVETGIRSLVVGMFPEFPTTSNFCRG